jgi:hypothetical protein
MAKPIDYDALLKDFINDFFPDFIAFVNPVLFEAIDWSQGYEFLEQELINAMRGKFKIRGKRKQTDKLVKVHLKIGGEHHVFVHGEFQHKPEPGFSYRMYNYRALIGLRYNIENITAIAVFTGAPPPQEERSYQNSTFETTLEYKFKAVVAIELDEQDLINASDNPFAIAMLAAQYAFRSRNDPKLRLQLKVQLFNLVRSKQRLYIDKVIKLLIFVRDFVDLPKDLENEFQQTQFSLAFPNEEKMIISEGTKDFALGLYEHIFGYNPIQALKEERQKAEEERQKVEEERQKAIEEERQRINTTILNLHQLAKMPAREIATIVVMDLEYVEKLIAESQNSVHNS